jgi:hypothetical protein
VLNVPHEQQVQVEVGWWEVVREVVMGVEGGILVVFKVWMFKVWMFKVWMFKVWMFKVWMFKVWMFEVGE